MKEKYNSQGICKIDWGNVTRLAVTIIKKQILIKLEIIDFTFQIGHKNYNLHRQWDYSVISMKRMLGDPRCIKAGDDFIAEFTELRRAY